LTENKICLGCTLAYKRAGITICQNGGIFSELSHFYMHVVPRYKHQSCADFYMNTPFDNELIKNRLWQTRDEMVEVIKGIVIT
jgi:histidine triad (HIT) family protein